MCVPMYNLVKYGELYSQVPKGDSWGTCQTPYSKYIGDFLKKVPLFNSLILAKLNLAMAPIM